MAALSRPPDRLILAERHRAQMERHVATEAPLEACGILAGVKDHSQRVFPVENILKRTDRYRMDPQQQFNIFMELEEKDWGFLAVYHSHPGGPPEPSALDVAEAYYPDTLQIIWSPSPAGWSCRAFQVYAGIVRQVPVEPGD